MIIVIGIPMKLKLLYSHGHGRSQTKTNKQTTTKTNTKKGFSCIDSCNFTKPILKMFFISLTYLYCFEIQETPKCSKSAIQKYVRVIKINRRNFNIKRSSNLLVKSLHSFTFSLQLIYKFVKRLKPTIDCESSKRDIFFNTPSVKLLNLCCTFPKLSLTCKEKKKTKKTKTKKQKKQKQILRSCKHPDPLKRGT